MMNCLPQFSPKPEKMKLDQNIYLQGVGRTKRQFDQTVCEHLGYIGNERSEEPSRLHFCLPGHSKHRRGSNQEP